LFRRSTAMVKIDAGPTSTKNSHPKARCRMRDSRAEVLKGRPHYANRAS
jgi:hypothetical protein